MAVIIGIDPHKSTHTAVAIDGEERPIDRLELQRGPGPAAAAAGVGDTAERGQDVGGGIGWGLGKLLAQQLVGAGEQVVDVPPTLAARVRLLGSTKASKNDRNDALATAIAGLRHCGLRTVGLEDQAAVIRLVIDRYDDLTGLRTQAACRLHVALRELIAGGAPRRLSADRAAKRCAACTPTASP